MSIRRKIASTVAAGFMALGGGVIAAAPAHAASFAFGCQPGYVCIYADSTLNALQNGNIIARFDRYGANNLDNINGNHWVVNNQTGGSNATAVMCYNYWGGNCSGRVVDVQPDGWNTAVVVDLTPINSIWLNRP
ncbi:hypothetical protein F4556_007263 [Kitasatospora gansuensis]|uniref:Peptidase inhibitor family I36 n=1 Tax=Kitasatospora gansuensis TaxID=258050 RepID=A0A7W7SKU5_9ACTN|nr:hypothetical protein [Kitasatospora gansuensis]MBB4951728.1 hypothetical protein [Kitasatospora gansuensis]